MRGGLHLIAHKQASTTTSLAMASVPKQLSLAIVTPNGSALSLFVGVGDNVLLGQLLARTPDAAVYASASGLVSSINQSAATCTFIIDTDGRDAPHSSFRPIADYSQLSSAALRERIEQAGISGLGGACFSTAIKLNVAAQHQVPLLIVNGAECEPFITCDDLLMRERAADVVLGAQILLHACGATEAVIAIEDNKPQAMTAIAQALKHASDARLRLQAVGTHYPAGGERQLVHLLTGKEVPSGGIPPDIGVLCQNVGTAAAIAQLIRTGMPLTSRIVTVTGNGVCQPRNLIARFGTPIASLIADCGGYAGSVVRLIMGGSMMGVALPHDELTVSTATNCIVAAAQSDLRARGAEMPCIRCGECAYACPAGLLPQQLLRYARLQDRAALKELGLRDCIECGCCDYVCPSQIPLTATFVATKLQA